MRHQFSAVIMRAMGLRQEDLSFQNRRNHSKVQQMKHEQKERLLGVKTENEFWMVVDDLTNQKHQIDAVNSEQLKGVFHKCMNPITPIPLAFDQEHLTLQEGVEATIPSITHDETDEQFLLSSIH